VQSLVDGGEAVRIELQEMSEAPDARMRLHGPVHSAREPSSLAWLADSAIEQEMRDVQFSNEKRRLRV